LEVASKIHVQLFPEFGVWGLGVRVAHSKDRRLPGMLERSSRK
jgi:hypothetical protein